jgi:hypothetical protein
MATEKPKTQREILEHIWYAVEGTNGDGLKDVVRENAKQIGQLADACNGQAQAIDSVAEKFETYINKERMESCPYMEEKDDRARMQKMRRSSWLKVKDLILFALAIVSGMGALFAILAMLGKL